MEIEVQTDLTFKRTLGIPRPNLQDRSMQTLFTYNEDVSNLLVMFELAKGISFTVIRGGIVDISEEDPEEDLEREVTSFIPTEFNEEISSLTGEDDSEPDEELSLLEKNTNNENLDNLENDKGITEDQDDGKEEQLSNEDNENTHPLEDNVGNESIQSIDKKSASNEIIIENLPPDDIKDNLLNSENENTVRNNDQEEKMNEIIEDKPEDISLKNENDSITKPEEEKDIPNLENISLKDENEGIAESEQSVEKVDEIREDNSSLSDKQVDKSNNDENVLDDPDDNEQKIDKVSEVNKNDNIETEGILQIHNLENNEINMKEKSIRKDEAESSLVNVPGIETQTFISFGYQNKIEQTTQTLYSYRPSYQTIKLLDEFVRNPVDIEQQSIEVAYLQNNNIEVQTNIIANLYKNEASTQTDFTFTFSTSDLKVKEKLILAGGDVITPKTSGFSHQINASGDTLLDSTYKVEKSVEFKEMPLFSKEIQDHQLDFETEEDIYKDYFQQLYKPEEKEEEKYDVNEEDKEEIVEEIQEDKKEIEEEIQEDKEEIGEEIQEDKEEIGEEIQEDKEEIGEEIQEDKEEIQEVETIRHMMMIQIINDILNLVMKTTENKQVKELLAKKEDLRSDKLAAQQSYEEVIDQYMSTIKTDYVPIILLSTSGEQKDTSDDDWWISYMDIDPLKKEFEKERETTISKNILCSKPCALNLADNQEPKKKFLFKYNDGDDNDEKEIYKDLEIELFIDFSNEPQLQKDYEEGFFTADEEEYSDLYIINETGNEEDYFSTSEVNEKESGGNKGERSSSLNRLNENDNNNYADDSEEYNDADSSGPDGGSIDNNRDDKGDDEGDDDDDDDDDYKTTDDDIDEDEVKGEDEDNHKDTMLCPGMTKNSIFPCPSEKACTSTRPVCLSVIRPELTPGLRQPTRIRDPNAIVKEAVRYYERELGPLQNELSQISSKVREMNLLDDNKSSCKQSMKKFKSEIQTEQKSEQYPHQLPSGGGNVGIYIMPSPYIPPSMMYMNPQMQNLMPFMMSQFQGLSTNHNRHNSPTHIRNNLRHQFRSPPRSGRGKLMEKQPPEYSNSESESETYDTNSSDDTCHYSDRQKQKYKTNYSTESPALRRGQSMWCGPDTIDFDNPIYDRESKFSRKKREKQNPLISIQDSFRCYERRCN